MLAKIAYLRDLQIFALRLRELRHAREIRENHGDKTKDLTNQRKNIAINTVRHYTPQLHYEYFIAYLLALRGHNVFIFLDDGCLDHWDSIRKVEVSGRGALSPFKDGWVRSKYTLFLSHLVKKAYQHERIKTVAYSQLHKRTSPLENNLKEHDQRHIISSARRYDSDYKKWNDGSIRDTSYFKMSQENALTARQLAVVAFEKYRIKKLITSHGIYTTWGIFCDVAEEMNIETCVYSDCPYRTKMFWLTQFAIPRAGEEPSWHLHAASPETTISPKRAKEIDDLLEERIRYKSKDNLNYYRVEALHSRVIEKQKDQKVFCMFPNVVYDGAIEERNALFKDLVDWVTSTIRYFATQRENILVVRCHPAEASTSFAKIDQSEMLETIIRKVIPEIDNIENVTIISSSEGLSTYEFIKQNVDVGIVYDGMISFELCYLKTPVISCAKGRYAGSGFGFEPSTKEEYYSLLRESRTTIENFEREYDARRKNLYKFLQWYLYEITYYFPLFTKKGGFDFDIIGTSTHDMDEDEVHELKRTLNRLS